MGRRDFVRNVALAGLGVAAASLLAACGAGDGSRSGSSAPVSGGTPTPATGSGFKSDRSVPGAAKVYATTDISAGGLLRVYQALGWSPAGNTAIKLHMGEEGGSYFLQSSLLQDLIQNVNGTCVDCTVFYGGRRSTVEGYRSLAAEHGFSPVDILDADGGMDLPVSGGQHLSSANVGAHLANYQSLVSVAHFKGHAMAGFGGTFKNLAIGLGTVQGKSSVHGGSFESGEPFLERIAEFSKAVFDYLGPNMACVNVLNNLSVDCDCDSNAARPRMGDIGIMASLDPLALDTASVDQVYLSDDDGKQALIDRIESRSGTHLLDYAASIGAGSKAYELVVVD